MNPPISTQSRLVSSFFMVVITVIINTIIIIIIGERPSLSQSINSRIATSRDVHLDRELKSKTIVADEVWSTRFRLEVFP